MTFHRVLAALFMVCAAAFVLVGWQQHDVDGGSVFGCIILAYLLTDRRR